MRRIFAVSLLIFLCTFALPASGHAADDFYGIKWNSPWTKEVRYVEGFPHDTYHDDRVSDGGGKWNDLPQLLEFRLPYPYTYDWAAYNPAGQCSSPPKNGIHWIDLPLKLGRVYSCVNTATPNRLSSVQVAFDSSPQYRATDGVLYTAYWYTGTPLSFPDSRQYYDMLSVAAHEWGHAFGRITGSGGDGSGHYLEQGDECNGTLARHVMCPTIQLRTFVRTLQSHDTHTFDYAYP